MDNRINHIKKTIRPTASKAVGKYDRGLLVGRQIRAPDRLTNLSRIKEPEKIQPYYLIDLQST